MKGSTAGSNQKAPAGEQMRSCLSEKVNVSAQTAHTWSHPLRFAAEKLATLGAKRQCLLQQNGIHLFAYMLMQLLHLKQISSRLLDLGSDRIKAPVFTPCFSGFGTPQRKRKGRSMTAMEKEQRRHLLMIQRTGPHGGEKVRMSHFPLSVYHFITRTFRRWELADALWGIHRSAALPSLHVRRVRKESNLTLSNGRRFEFPLWDTGTSWETTTI